MRLMQLVLAVLCVAAFAALPGQVQARSAPLVDPDPVAIPAGMDSAKVVKDIKRALLGRGWAVTGEQPGQIDSTLNLRTHVARIRVTYTDKQVRFAYVDSTDLDYKLKGGKPYIHKNYLGWMAYLTSDLSTNLQLSSQD
ncbi:MULTISPECIES: hypothetical protein [Lysobacter]|jgi:hypothetical protein|uniref:Lipoprotein n=2 Tax=Lysobacter gummosus TaxID=262324 RepID=A0ABY3XES8_9GAMM|nr:MULTISPECIES: hypothetical protein [Lysobacter]ALN93981.1 putative lipoprotein [Lysobacter gummosus]UJB19459.1 hypothetical protein L1A79_24705 [Lysobacter capsici]UJQ26815.1 hypothetical protein L2D09_15180 [Lysobacter gummosus]UNP29423.1 hypothetical protein MOV92_23640 [Lysobacter gummosus]